MNAGSRLSPGQRFGAYLVEARVGEGGMGAVYHATDTRLGRSVALKVMRDGPDGPSADAIARFLRESRVGASLAHPNIVAVFEAGAIGDCPYLAMEWVDGASLAVMMDRPGALAPQHRLDILESLADALAHAHAQGVIHRDVKPTNVMIDGRGRARLVDFGIAKRTNALALGTQMLPTHARALLGTPAYMAPEQMLSPSVDARADQFSWGVLAYELLGGTHPNATVPPDGPPFPIAKPTPLNWQRSDVPDALAAVVHRAVSYEPAARFTSMDEMMHAWRAARSTGPAVAWTPPPHVQSYAPRNDAATVARTNATLPPMISVPMAPPLASPPRGGNTPPVFPWIAVGVVVASLVLVTGGVGVALVLTGRAPASLPTAPASPIALGSRSAFLEPLDSLKFTAPAPEVARAKAALEGKLTGCFDSHVEKDQMFTATIFVAADGRVTKATDLQICKEQHPNFYLCTERERAANPKKGFPTVPETVFACLDRTFVSTRFPRVAVDPGEATTKQDIHLDVR
jgi:eukaryotic-like serine/threonine-protein kinase